MARNVVSAEATVDSPADMVYRYLADMRDHHPRFLPAAFSDFQVESGGVRSRARTGRVLTESGMDSSAVTTFTVRGVARCWSGSPLLGMLQGIGGLFERMFAPRVLRAIHADELKRLDAYAREHHSP